MVQIGSLVASVLATVASAIPQPDVDHHHRPRPPRGQTRTYNFEVAYGTVNPDGTHPRPGLLVNGQFPGPTITADYGDRIVVNVRNKVKDGTSIHYHGLLQKGTPWYDGTPASEVCPIAPGDTFTQTFTADSYGASFWHSHYTAQRVDGLQGPMLIRGPTAAPYDIDLGAVFLQDWSYQPYRDSVVTENTAPGGLPIPVNSNLINGKGQPNCTLGTDCPANTPYAKFTFQAGKKHLLQVINGGADQYQCLSIDGHDITVISADFIPVTPYKVDCLTLHNGQRAQIIVEGKQKAGSSWLMRTQLSPGIAGVPLGGQPVGYAAVYYNGADTTKIPTSTKNANADAACGQEHEADNHPTQPEPLYAPATTKTVNVELKANGSGVNLFYQNGVTFRGNYNSPVLLLAKKGNTSYPNPDWNVYDFGSNDSVRIVFTSTNFLPHPMHLHGHNFQVVAQGVGTWNGQAMSNSPSRRDTAVLPANGYLVVQWKADNPGVWPFHCHVAWHSSTGFLFNVLEKPEAIRRLPLDRRTGDALVKVCRNWWAYTNHTVVDQIDSGL